MLISLVIIILLPCARFIQRKAFLRKQKEMGHLPNYEGCCKSFLITWFCSPCVLGQMNAALEKQQHQQHIVTTFDLENSFRSVNLGQKFF